MCKHEQAMLVGTANGITCRACGKGFPTYAALMAARDAQESAADTENQPAKTKRGRAKKPKAQE